MPVKKPARRKAKPGRPEGSKNKKASPYTAKVYAALTPQQKRALEKQVAQRKLDSDELSSRWGLSDLLRELVEAHLSK